MKKRLKLKMQSKNFTMHKQMRRYTNRFFASQILFLKKELDIETEINDMLLDVNIKLASENIKLHTYILELRSENMALSKTNWWKRVLK